MFALSTPTEMQCPEIGDKICADCYNLISVLQSLIAAAERQGGLEPAEGPWGRRRRLGAGASHTRPAQRDQGHRIHVLQRQFSQKIGRNTY